MLVSINLKNILRENMMSTSKTESVEKQRIRYRKEASEHYLHNQDFWNQRYRDEFMRPTSKDIDLNGKTVLEGMCASGTETAYLLGQGAKVVGLGTFKIRIFC